MRLYFAPGTIAVASALALLEEGAAFEVATVDFASQGQRSAAYLAVNEKGRVPSLETPNGILTETMAILEYAAPSLIPAGAWSAAKMREVMTYLATTMHVAHAHKMRGHRWARQESSWADMKTLVTENMAEAAAYLETKIAGPYVLGDTVSLADPYLYAVTSWLEGDGVAVEAYPRIAALRAAYETRASFGEAQKRGFV
ncbi:MAG: glutathione S-transferase family protein [Rhodobacteraceae bacterium]|nr:glutathione S-transferase family protein [Paracoccaceae bacterium]